MHLTVPVVRFDDRFGKMTFFDIDMRQFRSEGRVATMIGPVRIQDAQFGQRRIAIHLIAKISMAKPYCVSIAKSSGRVAEMNPSNTGTGCG